MSDSKSKVETFRLVGTTKLYGSANLPLSVPVQYPSQWFKDNASKPPLTITGAKWDFDVLSQIIYNMVLTGRDFNEQYLVNYLYRVFARDPIMLTEKWTSFGQTIGEAGDNVTIENLFKVTFTEEATPTLKEGQKTIPGKWEAWLPLCVCCAYRFSSATLLDYREKLETHIKPLIRAAAGQEVQIHIFSNSSNLINFKNFKKIIAGVDMLLTRFPEHPLANCRLGTLGLRYKVCSALTSWQYFADLTGESFIKAAAWIWTRDIANEFLNITDMDQETDQEFSYFPYFMEMGLSRKSPYSASHNPNLFMFVHGVGCSFLKTRSINARDSQNSNARALFELILLVSLALERNRTITKQITFTSTDNDPISDYELKQPVDLGELEDLEDDESEKDLDQMSPIPTTANPREWYEWFAENKFRVPFPYRRRLLDIYKGIKLPREGTMGATFKALGELE